MLFDSYIFPEEISLKDKEQYRELEKIVNFLYALANKPEGRDFFIHLYFKKLPFRIFSKIEKIRETKKAPTHSKRLIELSTKCISISIIANNSIHSFYLDGKNKKELLLDAESKHK